MEFKLDDAKIEKMRNKEVGKETKVFVNPINSTYKGSDGTSYGLFQRFYWDEKGVQFGGQPNFKAQGVHGPGKYGGISKIRSSKEKGGKFAVLKDDEPKAEGPTPCSYFGMGRSGIDDSTGNKFDR